MRIQISADSTCDLSREYVEAHHISIMPLTVSMGGRSKTYKLTYGGQGQEQNVEILEGN